MFYLPGNGIFHLLAGGVSGVRAYGSEHRRIRDALLPSAWGTPCPRCGQPMLRGQDLDLGHSTDLVIRPGVPGDRIEHADCNRRAGGIVGNRRRNLRPSREW